MCEVTGGRSYLISSQRMLYQCLESLVAKIQPGVVMNFEKFGNDPPQLKGSYNLIILSFFDFSKIYFLKGEDMNAQQMDRLWEKCKRMVFIQRNPATKGYLVGHWPIPEDFWLNSNSTNLVNFFFKYK
jgi:integrator complex subunit 6